MFITNSPPLPIASAQAIKSHNLIFSLFGKYARFHIVLITIPGCLPRPPGSASNVVYRGGGLPDQFRSFFTPGKKYRAPPNPPPFRRTGFSLCSPPLWVFVA